MVGFDGKHKQDRKRTENWDIHKTGAKSMKYKYIQYLIVNWKTQLKISKYTMGLKIVHLNQIHK